VPTLNEANTATAAQASMLGMVGSTLLNATANRNVLAAQQGQARLMAEQKKVTNAQPDVSVRGVGSQITYSGSLAGQVNFGSTGPSPSGGYQFLTGDDLQTQFLAAVGGQTSNGAKIDTITRFGNTLVASTSGLNAHAVFALELQPNSGLFTFTLLNPIDQKVSRLDQSANFDLSGLVQGVKADGTTQALSNAILIQVHNKTGQAKAAQVQVKDETGSVMGLATAGVIHQGGLAYTGPNNPAPAPKVTKPTKYAPPINPLTGRAYAATKGAAAATFGVVNLLA
jgi:hypothetical protein